jgi:hypothetical protein
VTAVQGWTGLDKPSEETIDEEYWTRDGSRLHGKMKQLKSGDCRLERKTTKEEKLG